MTGLQFDKRFWVCQRCKTKCVSYPVLKEHQKYRCKVIRKLNELMEKAQAIADETYDEALAEGQKVLEEWGL